VGVLEEQAMNCKHNWHFISADTDTLKCQRCGIETGPKTYEERVKDILEEPRAWFTVNELNDWADRYEAKQKEST
jgi:hypothetical protein